MQQRRALVAIGACVVLIAASCTSAGSPAPSQTSPPTSADLPVTAPNELMLPTLSLGPGGVEYRGGNGTEVLGPSVMAVDASGRFHIVEPVGRTILSVLGEDVTTLELDDLDITAVAALAAADDHLVVVEIFFSPVRHRVHRISYEGELAESIELPVGFRLEDGLSGVLAGADGQIILEFEGGGSYAEWIAGTEEFRRVTGAVLDGVEVVPNPPDLMVDGVPITADLSLGLGGLRYLGTTPGGVHALVREDVTQTDPMLIVVTTIEWYQANGELVGSARVPLMDQYIDQPPGVAMMPDGRVVALMALDDAIEIRELVPIPRRIVTAP